MAHRDDVLREAEHQEGSGMTILYRLRDCITEARISFLLWRYRSEARRAAPSEQLSATWNKYIAAVDARSARIAKRVAAQ
jgi:hypothetical protein